MSDVPSDLIDHVFVINLHSNTERYRDTMSLLKKHNLYEISSRFDAVPGFTAKKSPPLFKLISELVHIGANGGTFRVVFF